MANHESENEFEMEDVQDLGDIELSSAPLTSHDEKAGKENGKSTSDIESGNINISSPSDSQAVVEDETHNNAPHHSLWKLFLIFLSFGIRAFGGPVAQINMMKQQLVEEEKWITIPRFNRVLAVYQVLPGPEATELACYFGLLSRGRVGAVLGGLGFIIPGFAISLALAWVYDTYGLINDQVAASMHGLEAIVAAIFFKAIHKLSEHAFQDASTDTFSFLLASYGFLSFVMTVLKINFFITLAVCGILHLLISQKKVWTKVLAAVFALACISGFIVYVYFLGFPSESNLGTGLTLGQNLWGMFLLGLLAGLLTFGGAYTCIPFVFADAVIKGAWLTEEQFLHIIAITSLLPAPLVMFVTFVGFIGAKFPGAILMTLGIFLPAFSFTLIGHWVFEKIVDSNFISPFLDGVTAGVIGLVAETAFRFARRVILTPLGVLCFLLAFAALYKFNHKYTQTFIILIGAVASVALFAD